MCCSTQQGTRTYLNELFDGFAHFVGKLGEGDSLGLNAPVVRPQLKFQNSASPR